MTCRGDLSESAGLDDLYDYELDAPAVRFSFLCLYYACIQLDTFLVFCTFGTNITHLYGVSCGTLLLFEILSVETYFFITTFVKIKLPVKEN